MLHLLPIFIFIPLFGFLLSIVIPKKSEAFMSRVAFGTIAIQQILAVAFIAQWLLNGSETLNVKEFVVYQTEGYEFIIDFYFDGITATFLVVGSLLTFLITIYSRYYLHRESGYKRFFNTILFFYSGYCVIIFSGNFETLFIGWEILGISSFLLIAFYRERYLPVRNAFKVFSIYRLGDIAMILAMWMSHHLWHHNVTFVELNNIASSHLDLDSHYSMWLFITLLLFVSAIIKSAQFPFSSWLPRAMEGPTPSSAIFYGSLSVHMGVFMLLRTFPFWENLIEFRWVLGTFGIISSILATYSSKVQSTVKSQIAYSSIAQIGLIFVEIALGLEVIALIHFAGNAFLRTYQLLVSPSAVTYLIRDQLYKFVPIAVQKKSGWLNKIQNTIYVLSVKEWNLDTYLFRFLWNPFKKIGNAVNFINGKILVLMFLPIYLSAFYFLIEYENTSEMVTHYFPVLFALIGLFLVLKAFVERINIQLSWWLIVFNHFWIALAVSFNEVFSFSHVVIYLTGVIVSGIVGSLTIKFLKYREVNLDMNSFYGHIHEYKWTGFIFLLACLGLAGFPITTTFLGEDLIFSHIHENQFILTMLVSISLIIDGLALIRIYSRIFLGPHIKTYHPVAHRSS
jgi:NADH-quinone oxidoreductase subunit L